MFRHSMHYGGLPRLGLPSAMVTTCRNLYWENYLRCIPLLVLTFSSFSSRQTSSLNSAAIATSATRIGIIFAKNTDVFWLKQWNAKIVTRRSHSFKNEEPPGPQILGIQGPRGSWVHGVAEATFPRELVPITRPSESPLSS